MSYYTSAHFYRPGPSPVVRTPDVVDFLRQLSKCELLEGSRLEACEINFAKSISEKVPDFWEEVTSKPKYRQPWWKRALSTKPAIFTQATQVITNTPDFEYKGPSLFEAITALTQHDQSVGRLHIGGTINEKTGGFFDVEHPSGEPLNFCPSGWSLSFEPTMISMLQWDEIDGIQAGWGSFAIHGPGYFFPWTFREWVDRFTIDPKIQAICELCRKTWPVKSVVPDAELVEARRDYEDWWPYDNPSAPLKWSWGPEEG
ncbi:hypothetical protein OT109_06440 [Phycisphaeraceae bacterium D3-23]